MADLYFDEKIETLPPDQMRKLQDHRLRWQFRRCWDGSEWYRARFEAAGLSPETFGGREDLERWPLVTRSEMDTVDYAEWLVAPEAWISTRRMHYPSRFWQRQTDGDLLYERDQLGRANWACIRPEVLNDWPLPEEGTNAYPRHRRANMLPPSSRVRTYGSGFGHAFPFAAFECVERRGNHLAGDHVLAEIVNRRTGLPVPDGEVGALVLTDLVREANPLFRYLTGHRRILTREQCACGRTSSRLLKPK
jgi:phenylacetate-coenzyme A ligase PaaK-like adenylate-forming protein